MRYSSGRLSAPLGQQRRASGLLIEATTRRGLRSSLDQLGACSRAKYPLKIAMMSYFPGQLFFSPGQQITPQRASNELSAKLGAELGVAGRGGARQRQCEGLLGRHLPGTLLFRKGVGMVMAPVASARENAFQIRKIGAYASNKETPMFVDEKRQGDLNTRIDAPKNFGLT
jgi:hypothetical protein